MKFVIFVIDDKTRSATTDERSAIDAFNDKLEADDHWIFACGLGAPDTAAVIDNRGGTMMSTDGSFVKTNEYFSGFWIIEAPDQDMAFQLAAEGSMACNRKVELRPLLR